MTSLAEAYEDNVGRGETPRRRYLGVGLFVAGALLVVFGILVSTTSLQSVFGFEWWQAREVAGVLAGLGVPAVFLGIFTVLPASKRVRAAAAIGAGIAVLGVALFAYAYPRDWAGYGANLTLPVVVVYFFGVLVTFWCMFVAAATFKTRNDPGGTVTVELDREGEVKTVEVEKGELEDFENLGDVSAFRTKLADVAEDAATRDTPRRRTGSASGVGFTGGRSGTETQAQTNQRGTGASPSSGTTPTSDGGTTTDDIRSPLDDAGPSTRSPRSSADTYCGNCEHFRYVRTKDGMQPYCGFHGGALENMDACDEWEPNR